MPALCKNRGHRALTGYRRRRLRLHLIGGAPIGRGEVEHVLAAILKRLVLGTRGQIIGTGSPVGGAAVSGSIGHDPH